MTSTRAVNMNLCSDGSSLALWGDAGHGNDDRRLIDMYFGACEEPPRNMEQSTFDERGVQHLSANPLMAAQ